MFLLILGAKISTVSLMFAMQLRKLHELATKNGCKNRMNNFSYPEHSLVDHYSF